MTVSNKIIILATAAMLAGCSSTNEDYMASGEVGMIPMGNSDVEIILNCNTTATSRSSIESNPDGTFTAQGLGVFCLAMDKIEENVYSVNDIDWTSNDGYSVWMPNVAANVEGANGLVWADNDAHYYYPNGNQHKYKFYAYYPRSLRSSDVRFVESEGMQQVVVRIPVSGKTDILYGRDDALRSDETAYCAKYFHESGNSDNVPVLKMKHALIRLTFTITPGEEADALDMGVSSVKLLDVPYYIDMVVATRTESVEGWEEMANNEDGKYTLSANTRDITLLDENDQALADDYWVEEGVEKTVGQGFLVPIKDEDYRIILTLKDRNGETYTLTPSIERNEGIEYKAGKSYNVALTIHGNGAGAKVTSVCEENNWQEEP